MFQRVSELWNRHFGGKQPVPRTGKTTGQAHRRVFLEPLEDRVNLAPGDLDLTFGGGDGKVSTAIGISAEAYSVTVDSVGNYLVAGFSHNGLNNDFALTRYTSAGILDTTFGGGDGIVTTPIGTANDLAYSVAVDSTGKYVVAGNSFNGTNNDIALVRYTSAGVLDPTFGGGDGIVTNPIGTGDDYGLSVAVDASGQYVVAGHYFVFGGNKIALARYTSAGVLDTTFGGGDGVVTTSIGPATDQAYGVAVDSAGKYLISGLASNGANSDFALARYTTLGVLDTTFGGGDGVVTTPIGSSTDQGYRMTVDSAGRYVVAGSSNNGSNNDFALTRYTSAGVLDTTFGGGDGIVTTPIGTAGDAGLSVAEDSAGNYVFVGFTYNGTNNDIALTRFTSVGVLDTAFGGGDGIVTTPVGTFDDYGWSVAVDSAGKIVVAGYSSNGANNDFALVRFEGVTLPTLTAVLSSGNLTITDTDSVGKNNSLALSRSGADLVITDAVEQFVSAPAGGTLSNGNKTLTIPLASVTGSLTFNTNSGNDTLTINLAGGDAIPIGNITFNGGNPTTGPGDSLVITGGSQGTVTYSYSNAHDGSVVMSNFGTVNYTGLEPITNSGSATDIIFNLPAGPNTVTLGDDSASGNGLSRLSGATFELTDFANPTGSVTINRGNVLDVLTVNSLPDFSASLSVGTLANPFANLTFAGAVSLAASKSVSALATDSITVSGPLTTSAGAVTLSAGNGITLSNALVTGGGAVNLSADSDGNGTGGLTVSAAVMGVWTQQQQITATGGAAGDNFGNPALSSDGNTAIVGAYMDDVGANADQGTALVFTRSAGVWTQQAQLTAIGGAANDQFGTSVAISSDGNTAIIGAWADDVGGNTNQGTATVFTRSAGVWTQQAQLTSASGAAFDEFGDAVALSSDGNTAIVGARSEDFALNNSQGKATVFTRSAGVWTQQQQLTATDGAAFDFFGISVAISSDGNTAIVGVQGDDVGGNFNQGSAAVFTRAAGVWTQEAQLTATGGAVNDEFGVSVAISSDGNTAIVGAYADNVGANADQGTATVFTRSAGVWTQQQQLTATGGAIGDWFGGSVALSSNGNMAIVGATLDNSQGTATVFTRSTGVWTQQQQLSATGGANGDNFGIRVAFSSDGNTAIVGAHLDDVGANTDQGSTYPFTQSGGSPGGSIVAGAGTVLISAADVDLQGTISSTTTVTFSSEQSNRPISLGATTPGQLSLTDAELDRVTAGTLQIGDANSGTIAVSAAITHANNLKLATGAGVTGSGGLTNGTATTRTLTIDQAGNSTYSGVFGGAGANQNNFNLVKEGLGALAVSNANTYIGTTTINAGRLNVNGSTPTGSAIAVNNSATLGGIGSVGGTVTVQSGGIVAPGSSPGILTAGNTTFANNSTLQVEIGGPTPGNTLSNHDQLVVNGTVTIGTNVALSLLSFNGFLPVAGDSLVILKNDGNDLVSGTFNGLPEGALLTNFLGSGLRANITYVANIDGGGVGNDVAIFVNSPTLIVTAMTLTASGVQVRLNKMLNTGVLNLSDANNLLGPTDITLVGATEGSIRGSVVLDTDGQGFRFIKSDGPLAADNYTFTLRSAANGISTPTSELLDGNDDGTTGDNYVQTFVVGTPPANAVTVAVGDFIRGYGQAVNLPADSTAGIPITLSSGVNVAGANVVLTYDPALLAITGGSTPLAGVTATIDTSTPGQVTINVTSATQFSATAGTITLANLLANVPTTATYAAKQVLNLTVQSLTDTSAAALPTIADDGLHIASYRGDLNGDRNINTGDATLALRLQSGVLSTTGFTALQLVDPQLAADMNDDGTATTGDITGLLRFLSGAAGGFARIPALPTGLTPPAVFAADPQIFIPTTGLSGRAGDVITVPVKINVTDPNGIDLAGLSVGLNYDAKNFTLTNVRLGNATAGMGESFSTATPGLARFVAVQAVGPHLDHGFVGDLFLFDLTVNANATPGQFAIDLLADSAATDNNAHNLLIAPSILNGPDVNDGLISIVDSDAPRHNTEFAADVDADGLMTIKDILLTIYYFNQSRIASTVPSWSPSSSRAFADIIPDSIIDIRDVLAGISAFNESVTSLPKQAPSKITLSTPDVESSAENRLFDEVLLGLLASDEGLVKKKT